MLIINDEQRLRAGGFSIGELCKYCSREFAAYPLIMSDMEVLGKLAYNEQSSAS